MTSDISFRPVTREIFRPLIRLKVKPGQEDYVAPNTFSIAEAYVEPAWTPLAIFAGDELVGFVLIGYETETDRWWIIRFMIGAEQQGKGYGRAAMRALIEWMAARHGCHEIYLSYVPGNDVAERLYQRLGFVSTGEIEDDEIIARLDLAGDADRK